MCEVENARGAEDGVAILVSGDMVTQVALVNAPKGAALEVQENKRIVAKLAKGTAAGAFQIRIWSGSKVDHGKFAALVKAPVKAEFRQGGQEPLAGAGNAGRDEFQQDPDGAYATDVITAPERNPWNRRVRLVAWISSATVTAPRCPLGMVTCGSSRVSRTKTSRT